MAFVKDVTIPDGTQLSAGEVFTKTWRLQNRGTCTWTPDYMLVYTSGDQMGSTTAVRLPGNVGDQLIERANFHLFQTSCIDCYRQDSNARCDADSVNPWLSRTVLNRVTRRKMAAKLSRLIVPAGR